MQNIIIKLTRFKFKKKITFYFYFSSDQVSMFNKMLLFFYILLPLPFPARTPGLNFCFYGAQRQGARRLPGTQFISLIPKMILKQLFFYTFNWQMWRMPERAISERSVQPMLCGERSRGL